MYLILTSRAWRKISVCTLSHVPWLKNKKYYTSTVPRGTPESTDNGRDLYLSIITLWVRFSRYALIHGLIHICLSNVKVKSYVLI